MTVYIVTTGTYSDYSIAGVFGDEECAKRYVNAFPSNADARLTPWSLSTWREGTGVYVYEFDINTGELQRSEFTPRLDTGDYSGVGLWSRSNGVVCAIQVRTEDPARAMKIARERFTAAKLAYEDSLRWIGQHQGLVPEELKERTTTQGESDCSIACLLARMRCGETVHPESLGYQLVEAWRQSQHELVG